MRKRRRDKRGRWRRRRRGGKGEVICLRLNQEVTEKWKCSNDECRHQA